jgi:hypothetical protein
VRDQIGAKSISQLVFRRDIAAAPSHATRVFDILFAFLHEDTFDSGQLELETEGPEVFRGQLDQKMETRAIALVRMRLSSKTTQA